MTCKWDREAEDYLDDGEPCRYDYDGEPTRHCMARRTCAVHIGRDELTCPRCIGRTRTYLRRMVPVSALLMPVAVASGVNSEAANLAGPTPRPRDWRDRRIAMRSHLATWEALGRITEEQHLHARQAMEDDDERHPVNVLGRWCLMFAEDYGHDLPAPLTVASAVDYLDRHLSRIANDPEQDFPLFAAEVRRCVRGLEETAALVVRAERGAPCPTCQDGGHFVRLVREYSHWCEDPECCREHFADDSEDRWVCPRNREHQWTHAAYSNYLTERTSA